MKILIVQTGFLGDIILSTPVITGIKEIYPESEIYFLTTPAGKLLIEKDPLVNQVLVYDKRDKDKGIRGILKTAAKLESLKFDRVYSLHKSYRTSIMLFLTKISHKTGFKKSRFSFIYNTKEKRNLEDHDAIRNLSILSSETDISLLKQDLRLFPPDETQVGKELKSLKNSKYILLSPGSAWKTKMWHSKGYNETARYFENKGYFIVVTGAQSEIDICNEVCKNTNAFNLCGKLNLAELKFAAANAKLIVCNDSMALHLASALKTPCVCIFCSTIPEFGYSPWKNKSIIVEKNLNCRPCGRHGHNKCPINTEECMKIPSAEIINACEKILEN
jgi:heptosyltransferase-2